MDVQERLTNSSVSGYLQGLGWLAPGATAKIEAAGDGNINWVRTIRSDDGRSCVLKQARPALERFPEYKVTTERIVFEARYFETTALFDLDRVRPEILYFDETARVLVLEDLGDAERLDAALERDADTKDALATLAAFLGRVHAGTRDPALAEHFRNPDMQRLHGDHVFVLPYRENDFPLSPALRERAKAIWADTALVGTIDAAHVRYNELQGALVHADVQSGNVLLAERGPVLLDAEIAHVGDPAFDIGLLIAHIALPAIARGDRDAAKPRIRAVWSAYAGAHGADGLVPYRHAARHAGIELLRRTLGAARVPAVERDEPGLEVVDAGLAWVREPPDAP